MYINIKIHKKSRYALKKAKKEAYGYYFSGRYFNDSSIELFTQQYRSTIKILIHEIHHQVLDELINFKTCQDYDNIYKELEKFIFN